MTPHHEDYIWERSRQFVPNKRVSMLRLLRWRKMRRSNRRRKSVLAYWWAPTVTVAVASVGLFLTFFGLPKGEVALAPTLPKPGLYVVSMSQAEVNALVRQENVRRSSFALSDEDVGISLAQVVPEPPVRPLKTIEVPAMPVMAIAEAPKVDAFLPPMAAQRVFEEQGPSIETRFDTALRASQFEVTLPLPTAEVQGSAAAFWVRLNDAGAVVEVLRFDPVGVETAWLQLLRRALFKGRGTTAAQGMVRINWNTKVRE